MCLVKLLYSVYFARIYFFLLCEQQRKNFIVQGKTFPYCAYDNKHFESLNIESMWEIQDLGIRRLPLAGLKINVARGHKAASNYTCSGIYSVYSYLHIYAENDTSLKSFLKDTDLCWKP